MTGNFGAVDQVDVKGFFSGAKQQIYTAPHA